MLNQLYQNLLGLLQHLLPTSLRQQWRKYKDAQWRHTRERRLAWWRSQLGKQEQTELEIQPGVRMSLYFDSHLCELIYKGDFELQPRLFLNSFLLPGDIFIDVGANIGLFALIAAKLVGETGKIYAFEPCSKSYQRLLENTKINKFNNITCYQLALSDRTEELAMNVSLDKFDAWNSIASITIGNAFGTEIIRSTTADNFVRDRQLLGKVTMMKIDVEGWEKYVIAGATEMLSRPDAPVLQIEFTEEAALAAGSSCQALYHQLEALGYRMFLYHPDTRSLIPDPLRETYPYLNLFAIKNLEEVAARLQSGDLPPWWR